jgi:hypothetical protein
VEVRHAQGFHHEIAHDHRKAEREEERRNRIAKPHGAVDEQCLKACYQLRKPNRQKRRRSPARSSYWPLAVCFVIC